ncbi:hypothetical protein [Gordonia sp. NPDC003376]
MSDSVHQGPSTPDEPDTGTAATSNRPDEVHWIRGTRRILAAEWRVIRGHDPDLDPIAITEYSGPLLVAGIAIAIVGILPLVGTHLGSDAVFGPLIGSFALAAVATTTIAWLLATVLAGLVVLVVYHASPKTATMTTEHAARASFDRITGISSSVTLIAFISGLVSLAIALPRLESTDDEDSVLARLLSAQVACLLLALVLAFTVEALRTATAILGSQVKVIASVGGLLITLVAFHLAATVGPFEPIALTRTLLDAWLPATVDGTPRDEVIADLLPGSAHLWTALTVTGYVVVMWLLLGWRTGDLRRLRAAVRIVGH